jgi:hypothetical protein
MRGRLGLGVPVDSESESLWSNLKDNDFGTARAASAAESLLSPSRDASVDSDSTLSTLALFARVIS